MPVIDGPHAVYGRLVDKDVPPDLARKLSQALFGTPHSAEQRVAELRQDMERLRQEMLAGDERLRQEMGTEFRSVRQEVAGPAKDLTIRLGAVAFTLVAAAIGAVAAIVRWLPPARPPLGG